MGFVHLVYELRKIQIWLCETGARNNNNLKGRKFISLTCSHLEVATGHSGEAG